MDLFSIIGNSASIVGTFFALLAWRESRQVKEVLEIENKRKQEQITITLSTGDDKLVLPNKIRRSELSRAEVLGRIGMLPKNTDKLIDVKPQARFSIDFINKPKFLDRINDVVTSRQTHLTVECTAEELHQFDRGKAQDLSN